MIKNSPAAAAAEPELGEAARGEAETKEEREEREETESSKETVRAVIVTKQLRPSNNFCV